MGTEKVDELVAGKSASAPPLKKSVWADDMAAGVEDLPEETFVWDDSPMEQAAAPATDAEVQAAAAAAAAAATEPAPAEVEKSAGKVRILKSAEAAEQRYVLGIVLEPDTVDNQNDTISAEEIRKAAWGYLAESRTTGLQHALDVTGQVNLVESYIAPADMTIGDVEIKKGTWLAGFHVVDDAIWEAVKDGTITGLSIGAAAIRTAVE